MVHSAATQFNYWEKKPQNSDLETDYWSYQTENLIFNLSEQQWEGSCSGCRGSIPLKACY